MAVRRLPAGPLGIAPAPVPGVLRLPEPVVKRHGPRFSEEGGGVVVTCECKWLRFAENRRQAEQFYRDHEPRPKAVAR